MVSREELRSLLAEPYAYVHYGDRVTEEGFVCSDGVLAFDDLPDGSVGAISFEWSRSSTAPLVGIHDTASVACLFEEPVDIETLEGFSVSLAVGCSVAKSASLADVEGVRWLGDATLTVTRRPTGHAPLVYYVAQESPEEYRVSIQLDTEEPNLLGQITRSRLDTSQDRFQLAGTHEHLDGAVTEAELADILASDTILQFDWYPESFQPSTPPELDDLRST